MQQSSESDVGRKQSASDLQSRNKTRKLLGVGELAGDNGDVYRSKISQLLGINESLYVKLPRGLDWFLTLLQIYIFVIVLLCMLLPIYGSWLEWGNSGVQDVQAVRFYGASLAAFGILFRFLLSHVDARTEIATFLNACSCLFILQILIDLTGGHSCACRMAFRLAMTSGCFYYEMMLYKQIYWKVFQGTPYRFFARLYEELRSLFTKCSSSYYDKDKSA